MNLLLPAETALVLGGGGAKGAYEVGAMEALGELGIIANSVYGTSVGALNAAMYAQGNLDLAAELWQSLRLTDVVTPESATMADDIEGMFDHPDKLAQFLAHYARHQGMDTSPLRAIVERFVDEDAIRRGGAQLGLVTTRFPQLTMVEKQLSDMESGSLTAWLMASSACFPFFPMQKVGGERYIDGGFCDNTPVDMAIRGGARNIIAIDIGKHPSHTHYARRPNITYIRTSHPLGGLLTFDPALSARNRILGYNDTMRAFGHARGVQYTFDAADALLLLSRAKEFVLRLTRFEAALRVPSALGMHVGGTHLFAILEEALPPCADEIDYLLRACELCAETAGVNPAQSFTFAEFRDSLRAQLPIEKADALLSSLPGGRIGPLFSKPQPEKRLVITCLYLLLLRDGSFPPSALRTLSAYPQEMLCAFTLREIL